MATFLYARVSSADQAKNGESLETQRQQLEGYAASKGLKNIKFVTDAGVSASKRSTINRKQWRDMYENLAEGDVIVATKLDRLFRSVADAAVTFQKLKQKKCELHLVDKNGVVAGSINDELSFNILSSVAQFDSQLKSERIREVKQSMKKRGLWIGGKKEKGFTKRVVDGDRVAVVDESERWILERCAEWMEKREAHKAKTGNQRTLTFTVGRLRRELIKTAEQMSSATRLEDYKKRIETKDRKRIAELQKQGKDLVVNVRRFGEATLYRLIDASNRNNAAARLKRMDDLSKQVKVVDGEWRKATRKSRASTAKQQLLQIV